MADISREVSSGLRERKKLRTRATLVDAAVELCLKHGYEQTTVEQIATLAEVSPRTFSRYFATKEAVFLDIVEDYAHELVVELEKVPAEVGPLEALRRAHVGVLTRVANRRVGALSADRLALVLRVVFASDTLRRGSVEYRRDLTEEMLAKRMGLDIDDRRVRLVSLISATTIMAACGDLTPDTAAVHLEPMALVDLLNEAYGHVAAMSSDVAKPSTGVDHEPVYG